MSQDTRDAVRVTLDGGKTVACASGTTAGALAAGEPASPDGLPWIGALVNNEVVSLTFRIQVDAELRFLTMADPHGWRIYERSVSFLLAKTVHELFPNVRFSLDYSFGPGLYCGFEEVGAPPRTRVVSKAEADSIRQRLRETVARDVPIERYKISFTDAVRRFEGTGQTDKLNLLRFHNRPRIAVYRCEEYSDLSYGPIAPSTGSLAHFDIVPYPPGFVLQLPSKGEPRQVAPFRDQPHLFQIFQEHKQWGRILGVNTVGRLNAVIAGGEVSTFVKIAEALHEKKVAWIADRIAERSPRPRVVLISGPSSAGKTTFSKRLSIQLLVNGLRTVGLSLDDYFAPHERTPRDASGQLDFEHIEAIDIELLNAQLLRLIGGEPVRVPRFNFETKRREERKDELRLAEDQILIIEGIHGLNPRLTPMIPADRGFRIYISALTQLAMDAENRISTTDNRLIRRVVRDHKYRGHTALTTLRMWPSVRRGEEVWVFPFQGHANATFNSALDYELAVLKPMVAPLLVEVKPSDPEYAEARRLTEFLDHFLQIPDREVPSTSILREYIGRSSFHY